MSKAIVDLGGILITAGFASQEGVDIFYDFEPETPYSAVTINEFSSLPPDFPGTFLNRDFQINVRDPLASTASTKSFSIYNFLNTESYMEFELPNGRFFILSLSTGPTKTIANSNYTVYSFDISVKTQSDT